MNERVLFVDDEPKILEAYGRTLRKKFTVVAAKSGQQALELMAEDGPFPVVVSDMQMPQMNGVELLSTIKKQYPFTIRLMLTGNADQETAVSAINTSDVYRFLNKPCPPEEMALAIQSALKFYRIQKAEQELLEKTLKGSIKALVEILSIVSPKIFGRASTIRSYVLKCAKILKIRSTWELEATALLSQVGIVTLPDSVLDRALTGALLTDDEQTAFDKYPAVGARLIDRIPRLENISKAIRYQNKGFDGSGQPDDILTGNELPLGSRMLKAISDLVAIEASGLTKEEALARLKSTPQYYDPVILDALSQIVCTSHEMVVKEICISQLTEGMKFASNVTTTSGMLLVSKGQEISTSLVERLNNFRRNNEIPEKLNVFVINETEN